MIIYYVCTYNLKIVFYIDIKWNYLKKIKFFYSLLHGIPNSQWEMKENIFGFQISLQEGCKKILVSDGLSLLERLIKTQKRGIFVDGESFLSFI